MKRRELLEPSPFKVDEGELIGKHPDSVDPKLLKKYFPDTNPVKAIRARCLDCCCDDASEVRKCVAVNCPSWPFRLGTNPIRKKPIYSEAAKAKFRATLAKANERHKTDGDN